MNFFYEDFPETVTVHGEAIPIITDFREYIRLLDMLKSQELDISMKNCILREYFLGDIQIDEEAIHALTQFVVMSLEDFTEDGDGEGSEEEKSSPKKKLFSYEADYPCILSGFLRDYGIDLETVEYLHWWKFRMLFDGLSEDTEIKQRIMYRGINLSDIKDKEERKRISRIQKRIRLPTEVLTDYDIGNAFA